MIDSQLKDFDGSVAYSISGLSVTNVVLKFRV